jgi:hypothetical protein
VFTDGQIEAVGDGAHGDTDNDGCDDDDDDDDDDSERLATF